MGVDHREEMRAALDVEAEAQRLLLAGDAEAGRRRMADAVGHWRTSWETAPARAFGRLVGMLKAAVIAGGGDAEAEYVRGAVSDPPDSPTSAYALALAALVQADEPTAERCADLMRAGGPAFERAAAAITALALRDPAAYAAAVEAVIADFEARSEHLTGVAIADTALVLETLAGRRGMAAARPSPLLPPPSPPERLDV